MRHPAAACGVVGFKPTYGSVPLDGCMPYAPSFDTGGAIARTVAEAALQHSVLAARAAGRARAAASTACASPSSAATSRPRSRTTSRRCSSARAGACARSEIDITWSQDDNRAMSPIFTAEPGAFVLEHDPQPDPAQLRPDDARRRRGLAHAAGDRLPAWPRDARGGAAALRGRGRGVRHPALRLGALRARADRRAGQDDAHERAHEALQRARLARALTARPASIATACRSGCRSSACRAATPSCCAPPRRSSACLQDSTGPRRSAGSPRGCARRPRPSSPRTTR